MNLVLPATLMALFALGVQDDKQPDVLPEDKAETVWEYLLIKYDANEDGQVSEKEYTRGAEHWKRLDKNADGFLSEDEFASSGRRGGRRGSGRGAGGGGRMAPAEAPKVGAKAPDFNLLVLPKKEKEKGAKDAKDGKAKKPEFVKLSSFKGKKPVALIFGSYT